MLAAVRSATLLGVEGRPVTVEVHVATGLPAFQIVGLPDEACRESRDRVRAAVLSSELAWPSCRITVNLAPSSQRKGGSGLDLAIAVGLLAADGRDPGRGCWRASASSASSASTARCAPSPASPRWSARSTVSVPVVPRASYREARAISPAVACASPARCARSSTR